MKWKHEIERLDSGEWLWTLTEEAVPNLHFHGKQPSEMGAIIAMSMKQAQLEIAYLTDAT